MPKTIKFSIFYNFNSFHDTLFLTKDLDAKCDHFIKKGTVVALFDKENNLYGYNIFSINDYIKIYDKGLISYPFDKLVDIINDILTNKGFEKIPYYHFSGVRVGKVIKADEKTCAIDFIDEKALVKNIGAKEGDLVLYGYYKTLLPSLKFINDERGELLKECDLFNEGKDEIIVLDDESLIGKDFYKGELDTNGRTRN